VTLKDQLAAVAAESRSAADLLDAMALHLRQQAHTAHALVGGAGGEDARALLSALQDADRQLAAAASSLDTAHRCIEKFSRTL
jgi:hypothetical protein